MNQTLNSTYFDWKLPLCLTRSLSDSDQILYETSLYEYYFEINVRFNMLASGSTHLPRPFPLKLNFFNLFSDFIYFQTPSGLKQKT